MSNPPRDHGPDDERAKRRHYSPPELVEYGHLIELTQFAGMTGTDGVGKRVMGMGMMMMPMM